MSLLNTQTSSCVTAFRSNQHPTLSRFAARTEHTAFHTDRVYFFQSPASSHIDWPGGKSTYANDWVELNYEYCRFCRLSC